MNKIEIIPWVKFNDPGVKQEIEKLAEKSTSKMDFLSRVKDQYNLSLSDAKIVADKFFKKEVYMLELKRAGLYIANGKNTSVLVRVAGEYPYLRVISGVLLNDMEKDGTVTVLKEDDPELQDIVCNPKNYIFDLPSVSSSVKNESGLKTTEKKSIEFTNEQFDEWVNKYINFTKMYPEQYNVKAQVMIISAGFSISQADLIIQQIQTRLRLRGIM